MNVPIPRTAAFRRSWLLGVLIALVPAACVTTQQQEDSGTVDIGYGEVDEQHVEGSVETVDPEEEGLERTRALADVLRRVPGVQVRIEGGDLRVRIRGSSSFLAGEQPLVVVDDMQYRGSLGSINPYDIESIRVLKNAGETAVYGARGANGVILITTKGGGDPGG